MSKLYDLTHRSLKLDDIPLIPSHEILSHELTKDGPVFDGDQTLTYVRLVAGYYPELYECPMCRGKGYVD